MAAARKSNLELAKHCGVSPRTVGKWRSGDIEITWANLVKVADFLGREPQWFYADNELVAA